MTALKLLYQNTLNNKLKEHLTINTLGDRTYCMVQVGMAVYMIEVCNT